MTAGGVGGAGNIRRGDVPSTAPDTGEYEYDWTLRRAPWSVFELVILAAIFAIGVVSVALWVAS